MGLYIEQLDLELRMTALVVQQTTDDSRDAVAALDVINRVIADAESYVESGLQATYGEEGIQALRALGKSVPHSVIRLCVDAAEFGLFARHPDYIRGGWDARRKLLDDQLASFRSTALRIEPVQDDAAVLPGARGEGFVDSGNADYPLCSNEIFDDMGIY